MNEKFDDVKEFEAVTRDQLRMIAAGLGSIQAAVVRLGDVDLNRGSGILGPDSRCLWTKDGRRITFKMLPQGGFFAALSRGPDPFVSWDGKI